MWRPPYRRELLFTRYSTYASLRACLSLRYGPEKPEIINSKDRVAFVALPNNFDLSRRSVVCRPVGVYLRYDYRAVHLAGQGGFNLPPPGTDWVFRSRPKASQLARHCLSQSKLHQPLRRACVASTCVMSVLKRSGYQIACANLFFAVGLYDLLIDLCTCHMFSRTQPQIISERYEHSNYVKLLRIVSCSARVHLLLQFQVCQ